VDVISDGTFIDRGKPVRVVQISGNRVVVREVS
jgi:membrane-bound ClpP family serine protease